MSQLQPEKLSTTEKPKPSDKDVVTDERALIERNSLAAANQEEQGSSDQAQNTAKSADADQKPKPTANKPVERKIKRLTRRLKEAQAQNEQLKERYASELEQVKAELDQLRAKQSAPAKPKFEDYRDPEEFAEAFAKWKSAQEKPAPKAQPKEPQRQTPPTAAPDEEILAFREKGKEQFGDEFVEVQSDPSVPITKPIGEYILDSDHGPAMYLYLANNEEHALQIAKMRSSAKREEQLAAIEAAIEAKGGHWDVDVKAPASSNAKQSTGDQSSKKVSKAPPPPSEPDKGSAARDVNLQEVDMETYATTRRKQLKEKGLIR